MKTCEIKKGVYWVGILHRDMQSFHGKTYTTRRGTTYNAYLIIDDKITLIDAVYDSFANEMIDKIRAIVPPEKIDYVVANHLETDHAGALPELMKLCPKAKIYCTAKCKEGLDKNYHGNWSMQVVKTGDKLELGKRTLSFIEAAMIHWPDSMFTYCVEDEVLFSNDAFGQHYATDARFDDEVDPAELADETLKYYANILWPFASIILRKIEEVQKMGISIKLIATSHGVLWRRDIKKVIDLYIGWSKNETKKKVVIVYETMWGSTEKMAKEILEGVKSAGCEARLFNVNQADRTEIVKEMFDAKGYIIGSSTHDNDMLPTMAGFLHFLKGLKPKNRVAAVFGSYGWSGGAVASIEKVLREAGIELTLPAISVKHNPDAAELKSCHELGTSFSKMLA